MAYGWVPAGLMEGIRSDRYLAPHFRFFMREVRAVAYAQFLESYKSVTLEAMARSFGVGTDFLDRYGMGMGKRVAFFCFFMWFFVFCFFVFLFFGRNFISVLAFILFRIFFNLVFEKVVVVP